MCLQAFEPRVLQVDHRVPYEVIGDAVQGDLDQTDYMLLCPSCNRAKSWSCEHCENWTVTRDPAICGGCYFAKPEGYTHLAMRPLRRLEVVWSGDEIIVFERLRRRARLTKLAMPDYVKKVIAQHVTGRTRPP